MSEAGAGLVEETGVDAGADARRVRRYRYVVDGKEATKAFDLSEEGLIDSSRHSLFDFIDGDALDGMSMRDRLGMVNEFVEDYQRKRHYQYRRVSLDGSSPVMEVHDAYDGTRRRMVNLASNDYLNLTKHPKVVAAGMAALEKYGAGAGSVPLLAGTLDIHKRLERRAAEFKGCEDALLFTSGFGMNYGVLSTLLRKNDAAIIDMYAHASLADGCRHTNRIPFRHNDMASLEAALSRAARKYVNRIVVVDGVYSMDGDIAPLDRIVELAHAYGALVMVDEAHASGVVGRNGRGTPNHCGVEGKVDIVAGTFSKGLGSVGGFVASSREIINYLHILSRPYFFSTAPAPAVSGALLAAFDVVEQESRLRERLWENIGYFRSSLQAMGFDLGDAQTAIFPLIIGDDWKVKELCLRLHRSDIYANPVPYPAVPKRLARVRMTVTAGLERVDLDRALEAVERHSRDLGII